MWHAAAVARTALGRPGDRPVAPSTMPSTSRQNARADDHDENEKEKEAGASGAR